MIDGGIMTLGEKLKQFRRINCLSQEKLAEASGISIRTIQRIEEGRSVGSGFTISALAKTLKIEVTDLIEPVAQKALPVPGKTVKLKILNLSAITMLAIPFANVFIPAYFYWKYKDDEKVKEIGGKILSFQVFWTLATIVIAIVILSLGSLLFPTLRTGSIPLFIPVYFISSLGNSYFVLQFAININKQVPFLQKMPNIL